jgi:hypothetical protein
VLQIVHASPQLCNTTHDSKFWARRKSGKATQYFGFEPSRQFRQLGMACQLSRIMKDCSQATSSQLRQVRKGYWIYTSGSESWLVKLARHVGRASQCERSQCSSQGCKTMGARKCGRQLGQLGTYFDSESTCQRRQVGMACRLF